MFMLSFGLARVCSVPSKVPELENRQKISEIDFLIKK
jgi:hypothetical protein